MDEILFPRHRPRPTQSADTLPLFSGEAEVVEPTWLSTRPARSNIASPRSTANPARS
jgi:hypothetical protein